MVPIVLRPDRLAVEDFLVYRPIARRSRDTGLVWRSGYPFLLFRHKALTALEKEIIG